MAFSNTLHRIIRIIGHQAAIQMVREYGGRTYTVPMHRNLHDMHPLVLIVGLANAERLAREFDGQSITLSSEVNALQQIRNEKILTRFQSGDSVIAIARDFGIDRKLVQKVLDRFGARGRLPLPETQEDRQLKMSLGE